MSTFDYNIIKKQIKADIESAVKEGVDSASIQDIIAQALSSVNIKDVRLTDDIKAQLALEIQDAIKNFNIKPNNQISLDISDLFNVSKKQLAQTIHSMNQQLAELEDIEGDEAAEQYQRMAHKFVQAVSFFQTNFHDAIQLISDDIIQYDLIISDVNENGSFTRLASSLQKESHIVAQMTKEYAQLQKFGSDIIGSLPQDIPDDSFDAIADQLDELSQQILKSETTLSDAKKTFNDFAKSLSKDFDGGISSAPTEAIEHLRDASSESIQPLSKYASLLRTINKLQQSNPKKFHLSQFKDNKELMDALKELELFNASDNQFINSGRTNRGGIMNDESVLLLRSAKNITPDAVLELKGALDSAATSGINCSRILEVVRNDASDLFLEIQSRATGSALGNGEGLFNWDFLNATETQIKKFADDLVRLQELGIGVDFNVSNIFYDAVKGFQFIDLDLNPASYNGITELIDDVRGGLLGAVEDAMSDGLVDESRMGSIKEFMGKFESQISLSAQRIVDWSKQATQKAQDSHSPSKVAEALGGDWGTGYANGILKTKDDVKQAVTELVESGQFGIEDLIEDLGNIGADSRYSALKESLGEMLGLNVEPSGVADAQIEKYEQRIAKLNKALDELRESYGQLEFAYDTLSNNSVSQNDYKLSQEFLAQARQHIDQLEAQLANVSGADQIDKLNQSLEETKNTLSQAQEHIKKITDDLNVANKTNEDLQTANVSLGKQNELYKQQLQSEKQLKDQALSDFETQKKKTEELEKQVQLANEASQKSDSWETVLTTPQEVVPQVQSDEEQLRNIKTVYQDVVNLTNERAQYAKMIATYEQKSAEYAQKDTKYNTLAKIKAGIKQNGDDLRRMISEEASPEDIENVWASIFAKSNAYYNRNNHHQMPRANLAEMLGVSEQEIAQQWSKLSKTTYNQQLYSLQDEFVKLMPTLSDVERAEVGVYNQLINIQTAIGSDTPYKDSWINQLAIALQQLQEVNPQASIDQYTDLKGVVQAVNNELVKLANNQQAIETGTTASKTPPKTKQPVPKKNNGPKTSEDLANAIFTESKPTAPVDTAKEKQDIAELKASVSEVTAAVKDKTKAFAAEKTEVAKDMADEIARLKELYTQLDKCKKAIEAIPKMNLLELVDMEPIQSWATSFCNMLSDAFDFTEATNKIQAFVDECNRVLSQIQVVNLSIPETNEIPEKKEIVLEFNEQSLAQFEDDAEWAYKLLEDVIPDEVSVKLKLDAGTFESNVQRYMDMLKQFGSLPVAVNFGDARQVQIPANKVDNQVISDLKLIVEATKKIDNFFALLKNDGVDDMFWEHMDKDAIVAALKRTGFLTNDGRTSFEIPESGCQHTIAAVGQKYVILGRDEWQPENFEQAKKRQLISEELIKQGINIARSVIVEKMNAFDDDDTKEFLEIQQRLDGANHRNARYAVADMPTENLAEFIRQFNQILQHNLTIELAGDNLLFNNKEQRLIPIDMGDPSLYKSTNITSIEELVDILKDTLKLRGSSAVDWRAKVDDAYKLFKQRPDPTFYGERVDRPIQSTVVMTPQLISNWTEKIQKEVDRATIGIKSELVLGEDIQSQIQSIQDQIDSRLKPIITSPITGQVYFNADDAIRDNPWFMGLSQGQGIDDVIPRVRDNAEQQFKDLKRELNRVLRSASNVLNFEFGGDDEQRNQALEVLSGYVDKLQALRANNDIANLLVPDNLNELIFPNGEYVGDKPILELYDSIFNDTIDNLASKITSSWKDLNEQLQVAGVELPKIPVNIALQDESIQSARDEIRDKLSDVTVSPVDLIREDINTGKYSETITDIAENINDQINLASELEDSGILMSAQAQPNAERESIDAEIRMFEDLRGSVGSVTDTIDAKTQAIKNEGNVVDEVVGNEITAFGSLDTQLKNISENQVEATQSLIESSDVLSENKITDFKWASRDAKNIKDLLGVADVYYQLRKDRQTGKFLESYNIRGENGSAWLSAQGNLLKLNVKQSAEKEYAKLFDQAEIKQRKQGTPQVSSLVEAYNELAKTEAKYQKLDAQIQLGDSKASTIARYNDLKAQRESLLELVQAKEAASKAGEYTYTHEEQDALLNYTSAVNNATLAVDNFSQSQQSSTLQKLIETANSMADSGRYTQNVSNQLANVAAEAERYVVTDFANETFDSNSVAEYTAKLQTLIDTADKAGNMTKLKKVILDITKTIKQNTAMPAELREQFEVLLQRARQAQNSTTTSSVDVRRITEDTIELQTRLEESGKTGLNFFDTLKQKIKGVGTYMVSWYLSWYRFLGYLRQGVDVVASMNKALTTMSYTMDVSKNQLASMGKDIVAMAKDLGASVENIQSIYQIYANMQTTQRELQTVAQPTAILANLSGSDAATAADQIQGVINQFGLLAQDSQHIVDAYDYISANIAVDYSKGIQGMSDAVQNVGNFAKEAGLSFEQLGSIVGRVMAQTRQDGSSIGNALRTIMVRLSKATNLTEEGEVDNATLSEASKALHAVGVEVYNASGEFREFDTIMTELAQKWDALSDAQQANISFAIAATRQTSTLRAVMQNWTESMNLANGAINSQGNALANNQKYLDSIAGHMQSLKTELSGLWLDLIGTDAITDVVDGLKALVQDLDRGMKNIQPLLNLAGSIIGGVLKMVSVIPAGGLFGIVFGAKQIGKLKGTMTSIQTLMSSQSIEDLKIAYLALSPAQRDALMNSSALSEVQKQLIKTSIEQVATNTVLSMSDIEHSKTLSDEAIQLINNKTATEALTMAKLKELAVSETVPEKIRREIAAYLAEQGVIEQTTQSFKDMGEAFGSVAAATPLTWITVAITVLSVLSSIIAKVRQRYEEMRKEFEDSTAEIKEHTSALEDLIAQYEQYSDQLRDSNAVESEAREAREGISRIQNTIIEQYGEMAKGIDLLNGKYDTQIAKLKSLTDEERKYYLVTNAGAYQEAKRELNKTSWVDWSWSYNPEEADIFGDSGIAVNTGHTMFFGTAEEYQEALWYVIERAKDANVGSDLLNALSGELERVKTILSENKELVNYYNYVSALSGTYANVYLQYQEQVNDFISSISGTNVIDTDIVESLVPSIPDEIMQHADAYTRDAFTALYDSAYEAQQQAYNELTQRWKTWNDLSIFVGDNGYVTSIPQSLIDDFKELASQYGIISSEAISDFVTNVRALNCDYDAVAKRYAEQMAYNATVSLSKWVTDKTSVKKSPNSSSSDVYSRRELLDQYESFLGEIQTFITDNASGDVEVSLQDILKVTDLDENSLSQVMGMESFQSYFADAGNNMDNALRNFASDLKTRLVEMLGEQNLSTEDQKVLGDMINSTLSMALGSPENLNKLLNSHTHILYILEQVQKGYEFTNEEMTSLIRKYPELASELTKTTNGYKLSEDALIDLANQYAEYANVALASEIETTQQLLDQARARIDIFGIELEALRVYRGEYRKGYLTENMLAAKGIEDPERWLMALQAAEDAGYWDNEDYKEKLKDIEDRISGLYQDRKDKNNTVFDWIEVKLENAKKKVDELGNKIANSFTSWTSRNTNASALEKQYGDEYKIALKAREEYQAKLDASNLSNDLKERIRNGEYLIESYNEETAKKINDFKEWNDKLVGVDDTIEEIRRSSMELNKTKFDNIASQWDGVLSIFENKKNTLDNLMSYVETAGHIVGKQFYTTMMSVTAKEIEATTTKRDELVQALANAVDVEGKTIPRGSEEWNNMESSIEDCNNQLIEYNTSMLEYAKNIRQVDWTVFDKVADSIKRTNDEAEFFTDIMGQRKLFDVYNNKENPGTGLITEYGLATLGLYSQEYYTNMKLAADYAEQVESIEQDLANDRGNMELLDRKYEMIDAQRESIKAANEEKEAIKSLVSEGIDAQLNSLQNLIDKYEEALDVQKDLYDYQKDVSKQTKNIADLRKQIAAYTNDTSEEARAKIQSLKVELNDATENLADTQSDRYISETKDFLQQLYDTYEDDLNSQLEDVDALLKTIVSKIDMDGVKNTLANVASDIGYNSSDFLDTIWGSGHLGENTIANAINNNADIKGIMSSPESLSNKMQDLLEKMNKYFGENSSLDNIYKNQDRWLKDGGTLDKFVGALGDETNGLLATISGLELSPVINVTVSGNDVQSNVDEGTPETKVDKQTTDEKPKATGTGGSQTDGSFFKYQKFTGNKSKLNKDYSIVDRLAYNDFANDMETRAMYYEKMGLGSASSYTGTAAQNSAMLKWMKENHYKSGVHNLKDDEWAWTNEGGAEWIVRPSDGAILTPLKSGDSVLTSSATENLWRMANDPFKFINESLRNQTRASDTYSRGVLDTNINNQVSMQITLPNVQTYNEFVSQLQKDKKFENMIQDMTINQLNGQRNSLAKYKQKY